MKLKVILFYLITLIALIGCKQNINVVQVSNTPPDNVNKQGIFYALPKTALTIEVTIKRTDNNVGVYYQYAEKLLGIKDYIKKNSSQMEIVSFDISEFTVPDENHYYYVELSTKKSKKLENTILTQLTET